MANFFYFQTEKKNQRRRLFKNIKIFEENFSLIPERKPTFKYVYQGHRPILEVGVSHGESARPWLYQKEVAHPGLYIIRVSLR